mgnify:CR=1 FL=1
MDEFVNTGSARETNKVNGATFEFKNEKKKSNSPRKESKDGSSNFIMRK